MKKNNYSFRKGFNQITRKDLIECRAKIMKALKITSRPAWLCRLNGTVEPKYSEAKSIELIFAEYGITEVWGDDYESECDTNQART